MSERIKRVGAIIPNGGFTIPEEFSAIAPSGTMVAYAGYATDPVGWLLCDGRSLSVASYPELFAMIGYTYGGSGGSFNIPDLRGEFVRGLNTTGSGEDTGRTMGSYQASTLQQHSHGTLIGSISDGGTHSHSSTVTLSTTSSSHGDAHYEYRSGGCCQHDASDYWGASGGNSTNFWTNYTSHSHDFTSTFKSGGSHSHSHTFSIANSGSTETKPRNLTLNYIIRY